MRTRARGWSRDNALPIGLDPKKAFGRSLLLRTKAEEAFLKADAAVKLSRLKNTVVRAAKEYRPGSLAMLWRARVRHGHGGWTGPLRVLLQEGSTVWLATGATLVRAKLNQLRPCTEREQLVVSTQGATIHQTAFGLDTLLKGYRGKHFLDASGETPGDELEENLEPAEVRVEPQAPEQRADRDGAEAWHAGESPQCDAAVSLLSVEDEGPASARGPAHRPKADYHQGSTLSMTSARIPDHLALSWKDGAGKRSLNLKFGVTVSLLFKKDQLLYQSE